MGLPLASKLYALQVMLGLGVLVLSCAAHAPPVPRVPGFGELSLRRQQPPRDLRIEMSFSYGPIGYRDEARLLADGSLVHVRDAGSVREADHIATRCEVAARDMETLWGAIVRARYRELPQSCPDDGPVVADQGGSSFEIVTGGARTVVLDCTPPGNEVQQMLYYLLDACQAAHAGRRMAPFQPLDR